MENSQFDWQSLLNAQLVNNRYSALHHLRIFNVLNRTDWRDDSEHGDLQQDIQKLQEDFVNLSISYHAFNLQHLSVDLEQIYLASRIGRRILTEIATDIEIPFRQICRYRALWTDPQVLEDYINHVLDTFPELPELEDGPVTNDSQLSDQQEQQIVDSRTRAYSQGGVRYGRIIWLDLKNIRRPLRMTTSLPSDLQAERFEIKQYDKLIQYYKKGVSKEELFEQEPETPVQQDHNDTQIILEGHTPIDIELFEEPNPNGTDINFEIDPPQMNQGQISEEESVTSEEMSINK